MEPCLQCGLGWPLGGPKTPCGGLGLRQPVGQLPARSQGHEGAAGEAGSRQPGHTLPSGGQPDGRGRAGLGSPVGHAVCVLGLAPRKPLGLPWALLSLGVLSLKRGRNSSCCQTSGSCEGVGSGL